MFEITKGTYSRVVVVDASLGAGARPLQDPLKHHLGCAGVLNAVITICHKIVISNTLQDEWIKNATDFGREWLVEMASLGKVIPCRQSRKDEICAAIAHAEELNKKDFAAIQGSLLKDAHLVASALEMDSIILTCDQKCVDHFGWLANTCFDPLRTLLWLNPANHYEYVMKRLIEMSKHNESVSPAAHKPQKAVGQRTKRKRTAIRKVLKVDISSV